MRRFGHLAFTAGLLLATMTGVGRAALIVDTGMGLGATAGATLENFNSLSAGFTGTTTLASGLGLRIGPGAQAVQGTSGNDYAAPMLSGSNGTGFGAPNQAAGTDATTYLAVGSSLRNAGASAEFTLPGLSTYFGLLWGSVDSFNTLSFFNGTVLVGTLNGSSVIGNANGDRTAIGTTFVNVTSDLAFNRVVATSAGDAFEIDNVAFRAAPTPTPVPVAVPEPASLLVLGMGLLALGAVRRLRLGKARR